MTMSDPLGDMLNADQERPEGRPAVRFQPRLGLRANVLEVLKREGYIRGFSERPSGNQGFNELRIELKYHEGQPVIRGHRAGLQAGPAGSIRRSPHLPAGVQRPRI